MTFSPYLSVFPWQQMFEHRHMTLLYDCKSYIMRNFNFSENKLQFFRKSETKKPSYQPWPFDTHIKVTTVISNDNSCKITFCHITSVFLILINCYLSKFFDFTYWMQCYLCVSFLFVLAWITAPDYYITIVYIQVRFINLIPMHFFHKSLHTP